MFPRVIARAFLQPIIATALTISAVYANPVPLTFSGTDGSPAWSPDGSQIVFTSNRFGSEDYDLWLMPSTGGDAVHLTNELSSEFSSSWSPDGLNIVFYWAWEGGLYIVPASGGTPQPFVVGQISGEEPAWSPDGDSIAFTRYIDPGRGGDNPDIWIKSYPTGNAFALVTHPAEDMDPTWSPDGKIIAFASDRDGSNGLWTVPATGGTATKVAGANNVLMPAWSPAGNWIAFVSAGDIHIISTSGGTSTPLTDGPEQDLNPAWSPSGNQIVFSRAGSLWVYTLETSPVEPESWAKIKNRYRDPSSR